MGYVIPFEVGFIECNALSISFAANCDTKLDCGQECSGSGTLGEIYLDPEACPFVGKCRCNPCPAYNATQCSTTCMARGQSSVSCAQDDSGCSRCTCKCIEYDFIQCAAICAEKRQILGSIGKNEFGCDECLCCNKLNILG